MKRRLHVLASLAVLMLPRRFLTRHEAGTLRSSWIVEHWLSWKLTCQRMACKNIRHKTMLLCKITSFQQCQLFDGSNMDCGSIDNPIDANTIFGQLCCSTDIIDDFTFSYVLIGI